MDRRSQASIVTYSTILTVGTSPKNTKQKMTDASTMFYVLLDLAIALLVLIPLALVAYKKNLLTKSGLVAAFVVGLGVWMLASWAWFLIFLAFFMVTALFTHYKYQKKRSLGAAQDKSGARSWRNVMANGILPLSFVLFGCILIALGGGWDAYGRTVVGVGILFIPLPIMGISFAAFLGALATHCADTLATEIGLLNPIMSWLLPSSKRNRK